MADLASLNGQPCPRHPGAKVLVGSSGKIAVCKGGDYSETPKCTADSLRTWLEEQASPAPQPPPAEPEPERVPIRQPQAKRQAQPASALPRNLPAIDQRQLPPHNLEAEQSVLGAILLDNEAIGRVGFLSTQAFYWEKHREIYRAMVKLRERGDPIDVVLLLGELREHKMLELAGGPVYLAELAATVPTAANIEYYAKNVEETAFKRDRFAAYSHLASFALNGGTSADLQNEHERRFNALTTQTNRLPSLISKDIEIMSSLEFWNKHKDTPERSWLVDGFLARKEISLWSGKVEAGKTTAMRTLVMALIRGEFFLERATYPRRVLYVMLDADGEELTYTEFLRLGWQPEQDPLYFLIDPVMAIRPNSFEQFHQKLLEIKPDLVVIDPLGRFQKIDDITDYGTTYAMAQFSELAKQVNCHIALLHHIPRGRSDADDPATAGFGSIAIAGGCNARFVFVHKKGDIYTIQSSKGKGGGFRPFEAEQTLHKDADTGWVTLAGAYSFKDQAKGMKAQVLEVIQNSDRELTSDAIGRELHIQRSVAGVAGKMLFEDGLVGFRKEGQRYIFFALKTGEQNKLL
jgi:hypothetical protein